MKSNRHIRYLFCSMLAAVQSLMCLSQESISGKVTDEVTDQPVAGVFISFLKEESMIGYCYSESDGSFTIDFNADDRPEVILASMLGYSVFRKNVEDSFVDIRLKEKRMNLNTAVVSETVMEAKGDTVSYMVSAFREKDDVVIADVLKRLPGIAVTESGGIIHNGAGINKFYIEGLDLLGSRYGIATQNLSANDISRVEVYQNHQPIKVLEGVVLTDRSAVNIILKENAKNSWMYSGDLAMGVSDDFLFDAKGLVTRFSKISQDLYLLKGNNVGDDIFNDIREQEYFGRTGAFLVLEGNAEAEFQSELNPRRSSIELPKPYWYDNLSGLGSFNHLRSVKGNLLVRSSVQIAAEKYSEIAGYKETVSTNDSNGITIDEVTSQLDKRCYFNAATSLEKNSDERFWADDIKVSGQYRNNVGASSGGSDVYDQSYILPSLKLENRYRTVIRRENGSTIDIASESSVIQNVHSAHYITDVVEADQTLNVFRFKSRNRADFGFKVGTLLLNASAYFDINHMSKSSDLEWNHEDGRLLNEKFNATEVNPGIGISTAISKGKSQFMIRLPAYLQIVFADMTEIFPSVLPNVIYRLNMSQDWTLNVSARYQSGINSIESLGNAAVMTDHRRLSMPAGIQKSHSFAASAGVRYTNNPAMFYISLNGDYSRRYSDRTASSIYSDTYTLTESIDSGRWYSSCGLKGRVSKYFGLKTFVVELNAGWHAFESEEFLQGDLLDYKGDRTDVELSVRASLSRWINAEASAHYTVDRVWGNMDNLQHGMASEASVSIRPVDPLMINGKVFHLWYSSTHGCNTPIASVSVSWAFKRFVVSAECRNLLDADRLVKEYIHPYRTVVDTFVLRGREYQAGIRMSL